MSKAFKCDKCGKLYDLSESTALEPEDLYVDIAGVGCAIYKIACNHGSLDLCIDCQQDAINTLCEVNNKKFPTDSSHVLVDNV